MGGEEKSGIAFVECLQCARSIHMVFHTTVHSQKGYVISQGAVNPFYKEENEMKIEKKILKKCW